MYFPAVLIVRFYNKYITCCCSVAKIIRFQSNGSIVLFEI